MVKTGREIEEIILESIEAGKRRDYNRAIILLSGIIDSAAEYPVILLYLGRSFHALGKPYDAIQILEHYRKLRPHCHVGSFFLARSYFSMKQYRKAVRHLKYVLKKDPDFAFAHALLGYGYLKLKKYSLAVDYFARAVELSPRDMRFFNAYCNALFVYAIKLFYEGYLEDAGRYFQFLIDKKGNNVSSHLYLSYIYRDLGKPNAALFHLDKVIELSGKDPLLHLNRAIILLQKGDRSEGLFELKNVSKYMNIETKLTSDLDNLNRMLANSLFKEKEFKKAIYFASKLLKKNYNQPDLHALIGESYRNLGEWEKAKNHFIRAVENDPRNIALRYGLVMIQWSLAEYDEIIRQLNRIVKINPDDPVAEYYYALATAKLGGDRERVIKLLQKEIQKTGPDIYLMNALGKAYIDAGLPDLSIGWFNRTLRLDSENEEALLLLIRANRQLDREEEVIENYKRYLGLRPDSIDVRKEFIHYLLESKHFDIAVSQINHALGYEPRNIKLMEAKAFCYRYLARYNEAYIAYFQLLLINPKSLDYLLGVSFSLIKLEMIEKALQLLERARKHFKANHSILKFLAYCYYRKGEYERASELYRGVLGENQKDWQAYMGLANIYRKTGNSEFYKKFMEKAKEYKNSTSP